MNDDMLVKLMSLAQGMTKDQHRRSWCGGLTCDADQKCAKLLETLWQFEQFGCDAIAVFDMCREFATGLVEPHPEPPAPALET